MTIRDLFECIDTDNPRVMIYDYEENVIWQKYSNQPIAKRMPLWDKKVDWIYRADSTEIALRIERESDSI